MMTVSFHDRSHFGCILRALCVLVLIHMSSTVVPGVEKDLPRLYAIIVGVREFRYPEQIRPLTVSDKDARDFAAFLEEQRHLFSETYVKLILNEEGTRKNVATAIRNDLEFAKEDDVVIVYLSGHGLAHPTKLNEYYFFTYDTEPDKLYATSLMVNDKKLFAGVHSNKVLLLADACQSGGFVTGLEQDGLAKGRDDHFSVFRELPGRVAISSSRSGEVSYEKKMFGNSVFTHFLIKGLRGDAVRPSADGEQLNGRITIRDLYEYIARNTREVTNGKQTPQLYSPAGSVDVPLVKLPTYDGNLRFKVQFQCEDRNGEIRPLENDSVLRSHQRLGIAFRPESDCYVYVFWWDLSGKVWQVFPNPKYGEGTGKVSGSKTYWLPSKGDAPHWYVLNERTGIETIYFVASRHRSSKLESLYGKLLSMAEEVRSGQEGQALSAELEREVNFLGPADYTEAKVKVIASGASRPVVFESLGDQIRVSGADAIFKVRFRHE